MAQFNELKKRGMKIHDFGNKSAIRIADLEQGDCNALPRQEKTARFNRPVSIHVLCKRNRLADSDGISKKYAIDALVACGILQDDSPKFVPEEPRCVQEKSDVEETIITITELEEGI
jgi:hypothetical protein